MKQSALDSIIDMVVINRMRLDVIDNIHRTRLIGLTVAGIISAMIIMLSTRYLGDGNDTHSDVVMVSSFNRIMVLFILPTVLILTASRTDVRAWISPITRTRLGQEAVKLWSQVFAVSSSRLYTLRHDQLGLWWPSEVRALQASMRHLTEQYRVQQLDGAKWETSYHELQNELKNEIATMESFKVHAKEQMCDLQKTTRRTLIEAQHCHEMALQAEKDKVKTLQHEIVQQVKDHQDALSRLQNELDTKRRQEDEQFVRTLDETKKAADHALQISTDVQHKLESRVMALTQINGDLQRELHAERAQIRELQDWVSEQEVSHEEQVRLLECQLGDIQSCFLRRQEQNMKRIEKHHRTSLLEQHMRCYQATHHLTELLGAVTMTLTNIADDDHQSENSERMRNGWFSFSTATAAGGGTNYADIHHYKELQRISKEVSVFVSKLESKTGIDFLGSHRKNCVVVDADDDKHWRGCINHKDGEHRDGTDMTPSDQLDGGTAAMKKRCITKSPSTWDMSWHLDTMWREAWRTTIFPLVSSVLHPTNTNHHRISNSFNNSTDTTATSTTTIISNSDESIEVRTSRGCDEGTLHEDNEKHADMLAAKTSFLLRNFIATTMGFSSLMQFSSTITPTITPTVNNTQHVRTK